MAHKARLLAAFVLAAAGAHAAEPTPAPVAATEVRYLSGHGPRDAVPWEFAVTGGRRAGQWSTLPVPSQWEQHGFGGYDFGEGPQQHTEHGLYRLRFAVPASWRGRHVRLVFEGVMTEATVKVNGTLAGPAHVGAFYRFRYDITDLLRYDGDNLLEVDVNKRATDPLSSAAETRADYWVFGGIFRPVWLEATPATAIDHVAVDARADGTLAATVRVDGADLLAGANLRAQVIDADGKPVGVTLSSPVAAAGETRLGGAFPAPRLWTAETPNLYTLRLSLERGGQVLHRTSTRFGFRTFEVRKGEGLFLNGHKILMKGVNRHSFRPETGRALDPEDSWEDARLIKSMNMNTARMSHYPPDPAFLEAADELGLYVLDELSGWQHAHGAEIGHRLVREMVERDVNHPSILFWDNGNEGGWNTALDGDFALYDPQGRAVLHPWALHDEVDTKHYPNWTLLNERLRGPNLLMPTEFLHALYDGGGGASLADYWGAITQSRYGAGAIFWVLADEGIVRTDQDGSVDTYSTYAPDGLVGPHHEKEGSYYAVRQVWSPIQVDKQESLDGVDALVVRNAYDFRSLGDCRFSWQLLRYPGPDATTRSARVLAKGAVQGPGLKPHDSGRLDLHLPSGWRKLHADALTLTAYGPDGNAVWTWTFAAQGADRTDGHRAAHAAHVATPRVERHDGRVALVAGGVRASFDARTGLLASLSDGVRTTPLDNGPRLVYARPQAAEPAWLPFARTEMATTAATGDYALAAPQTASVLEVEPAFTKEMAYVRLRVELSPDGQRWHTIFDASRRANDGLRYLFPPQLVGAVRITSVADQSGRPVLLKSVKLGHDVSRFPAVEAPAVKLRTGVARAANGPVAWIEADGAGGLEHVRWTLNARGELALDYAYTLEGSMLYHGVGFDFPEERMTRLRWLGNGPYRVWQNRLQGGWLAVHETAYNAIQPGVSFGYPEFQGMYADVRWARLGSSDSDLVLEASGTGSPGYLRIGTPRISHPQTSVEFPAGDLAWLHAIPAIGSKFIAPEKLGPSGVPATASGRYHGTLRLRVAAPAQR